MTLWPPQHIKKCPTCGQRVFSKVMFGIEFGWRQAQIMEELIKAGPLGIERETLRLKCGGISQKTLNAHISNIRQKLDGHWTITGLYSRGPVAIAHFSSTKQLTEESVRPIT